MFQKRVFRKAAVVLSLIVLTTILVSPSISYSAPEAPAQPPVVIDVEISLHKATVPAADRTKYENIIKRFADAVFEASEGENKIGKVTFYLGGTCADKADVVWIASCHPSGSVSGRAVAGENVNFCDNFPGSMNFLTDINGDQGGGYTLGHEWGHYYYSMYDEYVGIPSYDVYFHFPHSTDDAIPDAIMNDQWDAIGGHYEWINFSTANSYGASDETAQNRVYGASCWETLARPVSSDPRDGQRATLPVRIHHPELAAVAPTGTNDPNIDLPDTDARSELEIVWGSCQVAYQIVIDRSGSMTGNKLPNVKTAAKMLVDLAPAGYSTLGVIAYDETVTVVQPLTAVTAGNKAAIKASIDAIALGGATAIGDAAKKAHDDLVAAPGLSTYNKTVYLLSDGLNNRGINPVTVIPSYQASDIPIYAFAYGADADTTLMQKLATDTGGKYYFSPTSLTDITNAFQDANLQSSPSVGISKGTVETAIILGPESADDAGSIPFEIDSTLGHFDVVVIYTGAFGDMTFEVEHEYPYDYLQGDLVCEDDEPSVSKERLCYYGHDLANPDHYDGWILRFTNNTEGVTRFTYHITGYPPDPVQTEPAKRFTYTASVTALPYELDSIVLSPGDFIKLPQPVKLVAVLSKELPIKGAEAVATITYEDGSVEWLELLDNGKAPDTLMNDGIYTNVFFPEQIGAYNVSVQFSVEGGGAMTKLSYAPSHPRTGPALPLEPPVPIPDTFVDRNASIQVNVLDYDKIFLPLVER